MTIWVCKVIRIAVLCVCVCVCVWISVDVQHVPAVAVVGQPAGPARPCGGLRGQLPYSNTYPAFPV